MKLYVDVRVDIRGSEYGDALASEVRHYRLLVPVKHRDYSQLQSDVVRDLRMAMAGLIDSVPVAAAADAPEAEPSEIPF